MPILELSEEDYQFLVQCKEELLTQDNRCTANVIFFNEYPEKCYTDNSDGYHSDGYEWYCSEWDCSEGFEDAKDLFKFLYEYGYDIEMETLELIYKTDIENCDKKPTIENWFDDIVSNCYCDNLKEIIEECIYAINEHTELKINSSIFNSWDNIIKLHYKTTMKIAESGLFSFFNSDIAEHKKLDGHNYHHGQHSYGGSIQRSPKMLKLREMLMNLNLKEVHNA